MRTMPSSRSTTSDSCGFPRCIARPRPKCVSWYRLAPVEMIQSTNPASMSGMIAAMPSPAGVSAPVSVSPMVTSASSILRVYSRHASRRRAALYARKALSMSSDAVSRPVIAAGAIGWPARNRDWCAFDRPSPPASRASAARFCAALGPAGEGRLPVPCREALSPPRSRFSDSPRSPRRPGRPRPPLDFFIDRLPLARALRLRVVRRHHRARRLGGIVRDEDEIHVARRDLLLEQHARLEPANQPCPVVPAHQNHRELIDLPGLDEGQRLEELIERPEPAGEDDEGDRVFDEHRLPHHEVAEVDERIDVRIGALLEGQLDVAADGASAGVARAAIGRLHDARTRA